MKKILLITVMLSSVAFLYAQNFKTQKQSFIYENQDVEEVYSTDMSAPADGECLKVTNLSATYSADCTHCTLKWSPPNIQLWDNTRTSSSGNISARWLLEEPGTQRFIIADDFVVPVGEEWTITEVYVGGFFKTGGTEPHTYETPDFFGVEIYYDNGSGLPGGDPIFYYPYLYPVGNINSTYNTIVLSRPVALAEPGRYWLSFYGVYNNEYDDERVYFVILFDEQIEERMARLSEGDAPWESYSSSSTSSSLYFKVRGRKDLDHVTYNVYRDDQLLATELTAITFIDSEVDYTVNHTWKVTAVCSDGSESEAVKAVKLPCIPAGGIDENTITSCSIVPNPATNNITVTASTPFNTIEVISFLGQTVITQPNNGNTVELDISNLTNGIYFVRITNGNGAIVNKFVKQ
jgi:hypothetical protein